MSDTVTIKATIEGTAPLLHHNIRLANPFDQFAKDLKLLTSKRGKEADDYEKLAEVEFRGGMYYDPLKGPYIPAEALHAVIQAGGAQDRLGKKLESTVFIDDDAVLEYDGPRTQDELLKAGTYMDVRMVTIGMAKVPRCRPIFRDWKATFGITLLKGNGIEASHVEQALRIGGQFKGILDYRPRFGRFEVKKFSVK